MWVKPKVRSNPAEWMSVRRVMWSNKSSGLTGKRVVLTLLRTREHRFLTDLLAELMTSRAAA